MKIEIEEIIFGEEEDMMSRLGWVCQIILFYNPSTCLTVQLSVSHPL